MHTVIIFINRILIEKEKLVKSVIEQKLATQLNVQYHSIPKNYIKHQISLSYPFPGAVFSTRSTIQPEKSTYTEILHLHAIKINK